MYEVIFETSDVPSDDGREYRIVQTDVRDCIVYFRTKDGESGAEPEWQAVDGDAECAAVYMAALLVEREKSAEVGRAEG